MQLYPKFPTNEPHHQIPYKQPPDFRWSKRNTDYENPYLTVSTNPRGPPNNNDYPKFTSLQYPNVPAYRPPPHPPGRNSLDFRSFRASGTLHKSGSYGVVNGPSSAHPARPFTYLGIHPAHRHTFNIMYPNLKSRKYRYD